MQPIFVGSTTKLKVLIKEGSAAKDISGYDIRQFFVIKPSGTLLTLTATFSGTGTDGYLEYQPANTVGPPEVLFYDEVGDWTLQPRLRINASGIWQPCTPLKFHVAANIHANVSALS